MARMAEPIHLHAVPRDEAKDREEIAAVIRADTQSFADGDFDAWAGNWVHDERARDVYVSATTGLTVISGWDNVGAHMRHAFENNLACRIVDFSQNNLQITIDGRTAWAVFDGSSVSSDGSRGETFETRILEKTPEGWRMIYSSFVQKRDDATSEGRIALDKNGRVVWAEPQTLEQLKTHPTLTVSAGRIRAHRRDWDKALQDGIAQAARYHGFFELHRFAEETGQPFSLPVVLGQNDEGGVTVVHLAVRNNLTLLQIDGDGTLERRLTVAQAVFGLSEGQMRVARHIVRGLGLTAAAETEGISVNTARTHLTRLYEKTGVTSQTALVRLLLSVG